MNTRTRIVMAITEWDRLQSSRPKAHHNPYFLGIALGPLEDAPDEPDNPREWVMDHYSDRLCNFILAKLRLPLATREELRSFR